MPAKPIKRGYKVWVRADNTGYVCQFQMYTGKVSDLADKDLGGRVVKDLTNDLWGKTHRIFFDNYFSTVPILWYLKKKQHFLVRDSTKGENAYSH